MSSSESRAQMMSPLLVKAGIPAALSVAAYICAKVVSKRLNFSTPSPSNFSEQIYHTDGLNAASYDHRIEDNASLQVIGNSGGNLEDKLLELGIHIEDLQKRERELMRQFFRYRAMKEKEFMLMEIKSKMMLEKARAEFMLKEISLVQDESQRVGGLILEYIRVVHQVEESKKENWLLYRKARKLCKRARQRLKIIREQNLRIEAREEEVLSNQEELQRKDELIQELEDEISQMKEVIDHLQREKIEISKNLEIDENSCSLNPKNEIEGVTKDEHEKVLEELEQLQKDREVEANEITYLKWSNACLRRELLRCHELNKGEHGNHAEEFESPLEDQHGRETEDNCDYNTMTLSGHDDNEPCLGTNNGNPSRRRRFIQKVKKWVEGGKLDEKEKDEIKCFGNNKHSISEEVHDNNLFVHPRMSCSSV